MNIPLLFQVIDKKNGKDVNEELEELAVELNKEHGFSLIPCDMEGAAILDDGNIVLMDECGHYVYLPKDRFEIRWYPEVVKQAIAKEMIIRSRVYGHGLPEVGIGLGELKKSSIVDTPQAPEKPTLDFNDKED